MNGEILNALLVAGLTAGASGLVTWGVVKSQIQMLRHSINAAHRRLDKINAPAAGGEAIPEL